MAGVVFPAARERKLKDMSSRQWRRSICYMAEWDTEIPPCCSDLRGSHHFHALHFKSAYLFERSTHASMMECACHSVLVEVRGHHFSPSALLRQGRSCFCCCVVCSGLAGCELPVSVLRFHHIRILKWVPGIEFMSSAFTVSPFYLLSHLPGSISISQHYSVLESLSKDHFDHGPCPGESSIDQSSVFSPLNVWDTSSSPSVFRVSL